MCSPQEIHEFLKLCLQLPTLVDPMDRSLFPFSLYLFFWKLVLNSSYTCFEFVLNLFSICFQFISICFQFVLNSIAVTHLGFYDRNCTNFIPLLTFILKKTEEPFGQRLLKKCQTSLSIKHWLSSESDKPTGLWGMAAV